MITRTIYVALLNEGIRVWRPVEAELLPNGSYRISTSNASPPDEEWEFGPGSVVVCEEAQLTEGPVLVAVGLGTSR